MTSDEMVIPLWNLAIGFVPALVGLWLFWRWNANLNRASWSVARMLVQLMVIGYLLNYIFGVQNGWLVSGILLVMLLASAWIAVSSVQLVGKLTFAYALLAICIGGIATVALVTQAVLQLDPWYRPQVMIPLAGMIFSSGMNTVSLAAERLKAELEHETSYQQARAAAFNAALIPNVNAMYAVGLVSLPGMMTGQILSGVSPLIAVRYQIMVMCMIFGASTVSAAIFLSLVKRYGLRAELANSPT